MAAKLEASSSECTRSGSKRAEALETLTQQITKLLFNLYIDRSICCTGGKGLRQNLTPQAQRALIRSGSKRAEALETLTQQVTELQGTLQAERGSKEVSAARVRQVEEELASAQNSLKAERLLLQKVKHSTAGSRMCRCSHCKGKRCCHQKLRKSVT